MYGNRLREMSRITWNPFNSCFWHSHLECAGNYFHYTNLPTLQQDLNSIIDGDTVNYKIVNSKKYLLKENELFIWHKEKNPIELIYKRMNWIINEVLCEKPRPIFINRYEFNSDNIKNNTYNLLILYHPNTGVPFETLITGHYTDKISIKFKLKYR